MRDKLIFLFLVFIIILSILLSFYNIVYFNYLKSLIWALVTILLVFSGIYFSIKLKFIQFNLKKILKSIFNTSNGNISTFESLSINLAAKIGVGSLSGVALSIVIGGVGSIFWMWIITLITGVIAYIEGYLGIKYQSKNKSNNLVGGPSFYLEKVTNSKILPIFYSVLIILSYIFGFISIQSNTIVKSINYVLDINKYVILIVIVICSALIIFNGIKKIATFSAKIVPIMGLIYIFLGIYIAISNIDIIPSIIINIIKSAFNFRSLFSGFIGCMIIGIQRGIFATEIGLGTSAISSSLTNDNEEIQGYVQLFGIYFTTFVICTITALIVISANLDIDTYTNINGIELVIDAFVYHLGNIGTYLFIIITILFAFSTIVSGYCFGELGLTYITNKLNKKNIFLFKLLTIILIFIGGIVSPNIIWNLIDIVIALLTIINLYGIYLLDNKIR